MLFLILEAQLWREVQNGDQAPVLPREHQAQ